MQDGKIGHPNIADIEIHGWNLIYRSIISMHHTNKKQHIIRLLAEFMEKFKLDQTILADLIQLQSNYIIDHDQLNNYPMNLKLEHNVYDFLLQDVKLQQTPDLLKLEFADSTNMSLQEFLEKIYFGRRRNFGKSQITKINGETEIDFTQQQ
jgi:hypothetical protein